MKNGNDIRKRRKSKGLTQEQLAKLVGVSRMSVYNWEVGKYRPHPIMAAKVAEVLGGKHGLLDP